MTEEPVEIQRVETKQQIEEFIRFPFKLYRRDSNWVPPLLSERRAFLDPDHNPFFDHADVALWLARQNGEVVGTISSHIDHLHNEIHEEKIGMFGFFETVNDYAVADALLSTAREWVRNQGMTALRGPLSFSQNHQVGLLLQCSGGPPMVMMSYNLPYHTTFCQRFGLAKAMDAHAWLVNLAQFEGDPSTLPTKLVRVTEKIRQRAGVTVRGPRMQEFGEELQRAKTVYNQAWQRNWGFVPMTEAEMDKTAEGLKQILDPNLVLIAEADGRAVGLAISLPDINQVFKHLNGHLFPLGWVKALWYSRKITSGRLMILGVIDEYRGRGIEALLMYETMKAAILNGYQEFEFSWILENNDTMNRIVENLGGPHGVHAYRTYRIYQMDT